jgi:hypothetical protein
LSTVTPVSQTFWETYSLFQQITQLEISVPTKSEVFDLNRLFAYGYNLQSIKLSNILHPEETPLSISHENLIGMCR